MKNYIIKRILSLIPVFFSIIALTFLLYVSLPGDFVNANYLAYKSPAERVEVRHKLHLDEPKYKQFGYWLKDFLKGDLGVSFESGVSSGQILIYCMKNTFYLSFAALIFGLAIAIPLGTTSAVHKGSISDKILMIITLSGISIPSFVMATFLKWFFTYNLSIFQLYAKLKNPLLSFNDYYFFLNHHVFPILILTYINAATFVRYIRSGILEVINSDYIRTARAKGVKEKKVIYKHALKNAMIPVINLIGASIPALFSGSFMVEIVLGWPGMGTLMLNSLRSRDYPLLMGINLVFVLATLIGNFAADIVCAFVDPRIKLN